MLRRVLFLVVASTFLFSFPALAIVATWDYTVQSVFQNSTYSGLVYTETPTSLTWGTPVDGGQTSSLVIDPATVTDQVDTYVGALPPSSFWADSVSLTHNNFPITGTFLETTVLHTTVTLKPFDPNQAALPAQNFDFDIVFAETPNTGDFQNDVFALVSGFPNLNFQYDAGDEDGLINYFVNVFPSDGSVLGLLTGTYADLAGVEDGTLGFTTEENLSTLLPFAFTISTQAIAPIPEPSTLLLLGGGLAGLGFYARRRKQ